MKNIHAYTEPGSDYPAYVSINRDKQGKHTITVRRRGGFAIGDIELTPEQLEALATDVLDYLYRE